MKSLVLDSDVKILDALETKLGHLAAQWRGTNEPEQEMLVVRQYQSILRCMIELGFRASLDADAELPERLMPQEYLDLFST